jgi:hypothetical protein
MTLIGQKRRMMVHSARIKLPLGRALAPRALEFVSFPQSRGCCPEAKGCLLLHREGRLNPDPRNTGPSRWGWAIAFSPISKRRCGVHDGVFREAYVRHKGGNREPNRLAAWACYVLAAARLSFVGQRQVAARLPANTLRRTENGRRSSAKCRFAR